MRVKERGENRSNVPFIISISSAFYIGISLFIDLSFVIFTGGQINCYGDVMDVFILLDASSSVTREGFEATKS